MKIPQKPEFKFDLLEQAQELKKAVALPIQLMDSTEAERGRKLPKFWDKYELITTVTFSDLWHWCSRMYTCTGAKHKRYDICIWHLKPLALTATLYTAPLRAGKSAVCSIAWSIFEDML